MNQYKCYHINYICLALVGYILLYMNTNWQICWAIFIIHWAINLEIEAKRNVKT